MTRTVDTVNITHVGSFPVNGVTGYRLIFDPVSAGGAPFTGTPTLRDRLFDVPARDGVSYGPRTVEFIVHSDGVARATFCPTVAAALSPRQGPLTLTGVHPDGSTALTATVEIISLRQTDVWSIYRGTFQFADPTWTGTTPATATSSPLTNGGAFSARPVITLTPAGTTVGRRDFTILERTGRAQAAFPVRITFNSTSVGGTGLSSIGATLPENYHVFVEGLAVPFDVRDPDTTATIIDLRLNLPAAAEVTVTIYFGSDVHNLLTANTLPETGLNLDHADFSNTHWVFEDSAYAVSDNPSVPGAWKPAITASGQMGSQLPTELVDEVVRGPSGAVHGDGTTIAFGSGGGLSGNADSISVVTGVEMIPYLTGMVLTVTIDQHTQGVFRLVRRYRAAGQTHWTTGTLLERIITYDSAGAYSGGTPELSGGGAYSDTITGDIGASGVQLAIGVEARGDQKGQFIGSGQVVIQWQAGPDGGELDLDPDYVPDITVGAIVRSYVVTGTLLNVTSGDTIDCAFYCDGPVLIDTYAQTLTATTGTIEEATPDGPLQFSNRTEWFPLPTGSVGWDGPTGADASYAYFPRYIV